VVSMVFKPLRRQQDRQLLNLRSGLWDSSSVMLNAVAMEAVACSDAAHVSTCFAQWNYYGQNFCQTEDTE
jgi:hypothetical protein